MTNELTDVRCPCGTEFPAESYDAGFIAGSGMCQNCDAALPPKDICTCPSGDGSLVHPCPAHPAVEQAGGDERDLQGAQRERDGWGPLPIVQVPWNVFDRAVMWVEDRRRYGDDGTIVDDWKALKTIQRAALAQPSPVRSSLLINGYQLRDALEFIAPDGTAEQLESEARIEWRQQDADFLEAGLYAWCAEYPEEGCVLLDDEPATAQPSPASDLDPLNLAPHAEAFNEAPDEALKPEQAEAERPEVVAYFDRNYPSTGDAFIWSNYEGSPYEPVMTVAQHAASVARWAEMFNRVEQERDAALARCAELEAKLSDPTAVHQWQFSNAWFDCSKEALLKAGKEGSPIRTLYTAPAQAQHSVPETTNEEANSFLRVADAGQFKDNAAAVRTAAMIIRGLLHRQAIMKSIIRHRIGLTPEYEGQWHADMYGEDGEVQHHAEADTPDEAVRAVVALAAAPGKEGV